MSVAIDLAKLSQGHYTSNDYRHTNNSISLGTIISGPFIPLSNRSFITIVINLYVQSLKTFKDCFLIIPHKTLINSTNSEPNILACFLKNINPLTKYVINIGPKSTQE